MPPEPRREKIARLARDWLASSTEWSEAGLGRDPFSLDYLETGELDLRELADHLMAHGV